MTFLDIILLVVRFKTIYNEEFMLTWYKTGYVFLLFVAIYWIEINIKFLGLGWNSFRRNLWNLYDLIVVSGSTVTIITSFGDQEQQVTVEAQKLFMTALCFKLVQRSDSLNQLFTIIA